MEPPAKRTKIDLHEHQDDEANDDELSLTPSQFAARQDPLYELDKGRAKAASKLKSRFENIFEKYAQDFDGVGDEINLHTGEVAIDNGHLQSLEDDKDKEGRSGDEEEQEEEHMLQPKAQPSRALSLARPPPPVLSPEHNAALAFLQQSGWTPPPGFNASLSTLSGLPTSPQLFGTPNPLSFASSLFGPGPAPADPLWQTPELQTDSPQSPLGPFGTGQRQALSLLFAHHTQRKTNSARNLNLKRKNLLEGTLAEGDENNKQDGKTGSSVTNADSHDDDEDDLLLGAAQKHVRPTPLLKKAAKGTSASLTAESAGSAKFETDPSVQQDKTQRLPKGLKKRVKPNGKQTSTKQLAETTETIGKRGKAATVSLALPASENGDETAAATAEPVKRKRGRPPKPKPSVATGVHKMQPEEGNDDASALADRTGLNEPEPELVADVLPEIQFEMLDEETVNAQLMQAVNEALVLVTSPMKSWPEANLEEGEANERDRLADAANGLVPEHQDTDMADAVTPKPKAKANGHRSPEAPAPAGITTEADESAPTSHPKEVWTRNRPDPSFAFSDDEDEVDFQQSWGPPGDNNPDLFEDASPEAPALATDGAGAADGPVEDRAAVPLPETRRNESGREEPSHDNTVQAPPTEAGSEIAKPSSVTTLEINHSPPPNVEAEAEATEISAQTDGIPTAAESPENEARDNGKVETPPPKRRGRPSVKGRVPNARAAGASLEASINTGAIPTVVDASEGEARGNEKSRTPPPKRRGRPSLKGRVPKARTAEPASPSADTAESAKDRAAEPQSPPADFSSPPRDRVTEQPKPPSTSHSESPRTRDQRGTPRHRKDRPTGSDKNPVPTAERRPSPTPVQEETQAKSTKASPASRSKRRSSTLASLVPDFSDGDEADEAGIVWSHATPTSSSFASSLRRAAAHTARPSPKTPLHATSRRHGLLLGSARPRPSPASATTLVAGSSSARRCRDSSKLNGSAHNSPLLERVLKTTPRDSGGGGWDTDRGKKRAVTSGDDTIRTPGGTARRCGVDGFVCARDFCFTCCR